MSHDILPAEQSLDLLNVAFENPRVVEAARKQALQSKTGDADIPHATASPYDLCPDRITGRQAFKELIETCPGRKWRFVEVCHPIDCDYRG
jgi:hypothetical protein